MTDFRQEYPITVAASASIDAALAYMNRLHLHALLVIREEAEAFEISVLGLITAYEILRERPFRSPDTKVVRWPRPRTVREAMTPWDELPLIKYESLQSHTAAEGYELFKGTGLTHLLVVQNHDDDSAVVIGLLSRSNLAKRLPQKRVFDHSGSSATQVEGLPNIRHLP